MSTIRINGSVFSGNSISIGNGNIIIDGNKVSVDSKTITISVEGNLNSISADHCDSITVSGTCQTVKTMSGDVECGDVSGGVSTMSGCVHAKQVNGSVSTMSGNIYK